MGLFGGATETVKIVYKIDTDQAKAAVRSLSGAQKAAAKEQLDSLNAQNEKLEGHIKTIGKVALAVGGAVAAYKMVSGAVGEYLSQLKLDAASAGANLEMLRKASQGLKTDDELLEFAARALHTTYKLNNDEMARAAEAATVLIRRGHDSAEVYQAIGDAITKNSIRPLKEYGIVVDEVSGQEEKHKQILGEIDKMAAQLSGTTEGLGEVMERMAVRGANAWDNMKESLGQFFLEAIQGLSDMGRALDTSSPAMRRFLATDGEVDMMSVIAAVGRGEDPAQFIAAQRAAALEQVKGEELARGLANHYAHVKPYGPEAPPKPGAASGGGGGRRTDYLGQYNAKHQPGDWWNSANPLTLPPELQPDRSFVGGMPGGSAPGALADSLLSSKALDAFNTPLSGSEPGFLEKTFGKPEDFDLYQASFQMLTGAVEGAFGAWVDGSLTAGQAMKKMFADILAGESKLMFGEAVKHAAWAIGALAHGDLKGAGTHALAAAKFGAGAIVVGAIAREMGGKGAPGATASASGGGARAGGGSSEGSSTSIFLGDDWAMKSPRERALEAESIFAAGRRNGNSSTIVRHN